MSPFTIAAGAAIVVLVGALIKIRSARSAHEDDDLGPGGPWLSRTPFAGDRASMGANPMPAGASWVLGGAGSGAGLDTEAREMGAGGSEPRADWGSWGVGEVPDPGAPEPGAPDPGATEGEPGPAIGLAELEAPAIESAGAPDELAGDEADLTLDLGSGDDREAASAAAGMPGDESTPGPADVPEPAISWGSWESWGAEGGDAVPHAAGQPADRLETVTEPVLAAAEQSAALTAEPDAPVAAWTESPVEAPVLASPFHAAMPAVGAPQAVPLGHGADDPPAWWDIDGAEEHVPAIEPEPNGGYFALGGHALFPDQQVVGGVSFRRVLASPPTRVAGAPSGPGAGATLVVTVEAALNCDPESVEVVWDEGFGPTPEGCALRVRARDVGPFMVSGSVRALSR